jgi:hypothetical protein
VKDIPTLLDLLGPVSQADARKGKITPSNSHVEDNFHYSGEYFQIESIIDAIGDDILLDNGTGLTHEVAVRSY